MLEDLSLYLSVETLSRWAEGKANLPKQKQRANALFDIIRAEKQTKNEKLRKNTIKGGTDGESNGTNPVSYCATY